jgi:hypothetical protein
MSTYLPLPLVTSHISLTPELLSLVEIISENIHDEWALKRINEGWQYGPERNDGKKHNPCIVPYKELPENEKDYDRVTTLTAIKLLVALGYKIEK